MMLSAFVWTRLTVSELRGNLRERFTDLTGSERGGVAAEYALLVSLIAIVIVVGAYFLGNAINNRLSETGDCVASAPTGTC